MTQERTDEDVVRRDFDTVREALTSRFDVRAGMKPPPSIARAFAALDRLLARLESARDVKLSERMGFDCYVSWEMYDEATEQGALLGAKLTAAEERIEKLREALRYIERPTMGWDGGTDPETFAREEARDDLVRAALATCIRFARSALAYIPEEPEGAE